VGIENSIVSLHKGRIAAYRECYNAQMMNRRLFISLQLSIVAVATLVIARTYHVTSGFKIAALFVQIFIFSFVVLRYIWAFGDIRREVHDQADKKAIPSHQMWGTIFGRVMLYIMLPAFLLTVIMISVALYVTHR
jgi:hypothetical protein